MGKFLSKLKTNFIVDFRKSPESWIIIAINFVYFLLLIWPTFFAINVPGCDVEIAGYVVIFRFLLVCAFLFFAIKLRHISFENKGWAKWVLTMSLAAMVLTCCTGIGFGWIVALEFIATVPMLLFSIYIIIKYRKVVKDY